MLLGRRDATAEVVIKEAPSTCIIQFSTGYNRWIHFSKRHNCTSRELGEHSSLLPNFALDSAVNNELVQESFIDIGIFIALQLAHF